jgi:hypothetical protein
MIDLIIIAMPRSGSFWLSKLLTASGPGADVSHDALGHSTPKELAHLASLSRNLGSQFVGFVETAGALQCHELRRLYPSARFVRLSRDIGDVTRSLAGIGIPDAEETAATLDHAMSKTGAMGDITYNHLFHWDASRLSSKLLSLTGLNVEPRLIDEMRKTNLQSPIARELAHEAAVSRAR